MRQMIKHFYQKQPLFQNKLVGLILNLVLCGSVYAMPVKEKPDDKLHIVLNPNQQQLCVYSSDLTTYMQGYYVKPINITTCNLFNNS